MIHNKSDLIIEQAITNAIAMITELDDRIIRERDEERVNNLEVTRDLLINALGQLSVAKTIQDYKSIPFSSIEKLP
jgi:hypothetical protein